MSFIVLFEKVMHPELLKRIEMNIRTREKLCLEQNKQNRGYFEHLIKLKLFKKNNELQCVNVKVQFFYSKFQPLLPL